MGATFTKTATFSINSLENGALFFRIVNHSETNRLLTFSANINSIEQTKKLLLIHTESHLQNKQLGFILKDIPKEWLRAVLLLFCSGVSRGLRAKSLADLSGSWWREKWRPKFHRGPCGPCSIQWWRNNEKMWNCVKIVQKSWPSQIGSIKRQSYNFPSNKFWVKKFASFSQTNVKRT